jgi:hypothetical protein
MAQNKKKSRLCAENRKRRKKKKTIENRDTYRDSSLG